MDIESIKTFHNAVHVGDIETVRTMLAKDATLATSVDEYEFQPIHLLDMYFEEEILNLLLANGADINARNDDGITLLHIVTDPEAVAVIVNRGADIEARDASGRTPLIEQTNNQEDGIDVVVALLTMGANPNARDNDGETALSIARDTDNQDLIEALTVAGAKD
ncbi:ankyrin repeat protein [Luteibacter rhizovicinus]|uniref:Ankyrin repeat protein n=1 Tax=Luteibacter rhizovicinus TaxID=242606 RepID=A0A4R3YNR0_9GAMM|nr:ankyrin repeat domain-containing protein [Luteibacter rhizovicinus]TCV93168.1 ankyrin repeat protein [Luteibacter rhizovicinus]